MAVLNFWLGRWYCDVDPRCGSPSCVNRAFPCSLVLGETTCLLPVHFDPDFASCLPISSLVFHSTDFHVYNREKEALGDAMAVLNSSVNFVVYVMTSRRFRRGLLAAVGCARATGRSVEAPPNCRWGEMDSQDSPESYQSGKDRIKYGTVETLVTRSEV